MIRWTDRAVRNLNQAYDYIAVSNGEETAIRITTKILASVAELAVFPMLGRTGRCEETRELVIPNTPFIAVYTIETAQITILAVYHGAQRWPDVF